MKAVRRILGIVGAMGLVLWIMLVSLAALFWGFKPGGPVNPPSVLERFLIALGPMAAFVYYQFVARAEWSRRMQRAGIVVHVVLLAAVVTMWTKTDGGFLFAPIFVATSLLWVLLAIGAKDPMEGRKQVQFF